MFFLFIFLFNLSLVLADSEPNCILRNHGCFQPLIIKLSDNAAIKHSELINYSYNSSISWQNNLFARLNTHQHLRTIPYFHHIVDWIIHFHLFTFLHTLNCLVFLHAALTENKLLLNWWVMDMIANIYYIRSKCIRAMMKDDVPRIYAKT